MKALATTFIFLISFLFVSSQPPLVKQWDKRYGGLGKEWLLAFQQTADEGYIVGGWTFSPLGGDKTQASRGFYDYWLVKVDSLGAKQWDKRFGGDNYDYFTTVKQTRDGGFIAAGNTLSQISGDKTQNNWNAAFDGWVVKTDANGTLQWDKRYGGDGGEELYSIEQTADGGYMLGGWTTSHNVGDVSQPLTGAGDFWMVKIDSLGIRQWDKRWGGNYNDELRSMQKTADGGFILGGFTISDSGMAVSQPKRGIHDYWILKTDSLGNRQWDKRFGGSGGENKLYSIRQTSDKGFIMGGISNSASGADKTEPNWDTTLATSDYWIIKTDSLGNKQWDRRFGGIAEEDEFGNITQTPDGGYLMGATSYSQISGDKSESNLGMEQTWIVKIGPQGNKQWDKTIRTNGHDESGYVVRTRDGCLAIANATHGDSAGYKTQPSWNNSEDFWIIKFCDTTQPQCNLTTNINANQTSFCSGDSTLICAPTIYINYLWSNGSTDQCITVSQAGDYFVTVTDNNGCSAESNHVAITVYPPPVVSIITNVGANGTTLSVHTGVSWQWYLNGTTIEGATDSTYFTHQFGSYTVTVTDSNGCTATSNPVIISGIDNLSAEDIVSVFPNPSQNNWQLEVGNNLIGGLAEVFDANGRVVFKSEIINHKSEISPGVSRGVYLLRISSSKSTVVRKLTKL